MLKTISPTLTPGCPTTRNKSQYTKESNYVNGLGLPIAIVDRSGNSTIIGPTTSQGYTGKLTISIFHQTLGGSQLNALSSIQDNPQLAEIWGKTTGVKDTFLFAYEVYYEQLAKHGWFYIDDLDIIVSTNWSSHGQVRHPRFDQDPRDRLGKRTKKTAIDLWIEGDTDWEASFIRIGNQAANIPNVSETFEANMQIAFSEYQQADRVSISRGKIEILKQVALKPQQVVGHGDDLIANNKAGTECQKELFGKLKTFAGKSGEILTGLANVYNNVDRLLDVEERADKLTQDGATFQAKLAADNIKLVSPVVKVLTELIG